MNKNYIPLYRKYRPQTIEQIVGQEHIKKALANAIKMDRISHAYLFTGPRGTGKTSTARIFAKSLNCQNGPTISPCNECENCKNITNSIPIDVIEIDAASNRSVNDADEIIQKVALAPVQSRYKIYIIDEVHMLTNQAFNALLKTLEEPPKNVIFILATTEVHKVLDTIKSRCQRFDFKRITTDDITKHLRFISDKEEINITDDALSYIAQNAAGGMRDSIALLDQLSVLNSKESAITTDDINNLLGRLSFNALTDLFVSITKSEQNKALNILNEIYNSGNEPIQILSNLLEYLRNSLILKATSGKAENTIIVQLNAEQSKILNDKLKDIETHQLVSLIDKCASYIKELKLTSNPKLWLDVAILDMANLAQNTKLEDLQKRISMLESSEQPRMVNVSPYNTPPSPVAKPEVIKTAVKQTPKPTSDTQIKQTVSEEEVLTDTVPMSKPSPTSGLKNQWIKFLECISSFPSRAILKQQAIPVKLSQDEVIITIKNPSWLKQFGQDGSKHSCIVEAANAMFGSAKKIIVRAPEAGDDKLRQEKSSEDDEKPAPAQAPKKDFTPAQSEEINKSDIDEAIDNKNDIEQSDNEDSQPQITKTAESMYHSDEVNMVMDLFEGKIID
ncbi:MAG: DNA polymerase III subunit gamma/tau [Candidatus Gastranaerophilaceae bacterium]